MTLAGKLAKLFSKMVLINRKYTEPSEVLRALVDDFGNQITLGDQKDIGEFNLNFLERIEEGLGER
jgi:ubiquitin carboxyl-terminal hydrolase 25/28